MSADSGEWQVARRRKGKAENNKFQASLNSLNAQEHLDVDKTVKRIRQTVAVMVHRIHAWNWRTQRKPSGANGQLSVECDLRCESFYEQWKDELLNVASCVLLQHRENKKEHSTDDSGKCSSIGQMQCVCYGLGSFSSCVSARYQLAMLLLLLDAAKIDLSNCFVYDPIFSAGEKTVLKETGLTVLAENEEGKHQANKPTVYYLMHCGKALYNNILWKNWSKHCLSQIIIIGNSFYGMKERTIDREFNRDYNYISQITSVCNEKLLPCPSHMIDVFSDTAVISFPSSDIDKLPQFTWISPPEPQYEHCIDLEIIRKHIDT